VRSHSLTDPAVVVVVVVVVVAAAAAAAAATINCGNLLSVDIS